MREQFSFSDAFQDLIVACYLRHPEAFVAYGPVIQSKFFSGLNATWAIESLNEYREKHSAVPSFDVLQQMLHSKAAHVTDDADARQRSEEYVESLREKETVPHLDFVVGKVVDFCRERAILNAIVKSAEDLKEGKTDASKLISRFEEALRVGQNLDDLGYLIHRDAAEVVRKVTSKAYGVRTGFLQFDEIWRNGWAPGWLISLLAPPKRFKCLSPTTKVIMFDGSSKMVKDLKIGDQLMGDDSTPRTVTMCGPGRGPMFKIHQRYGENFECNDAHILCLKKADGSIVEITAEDYYHQCRRVKWTPRKMQGYKTAVEFPAQLSSIIEPYWLGLWLGDGSRYGSTITVSDQDPEISRYLHEHAAGHDLIITFTPRQGCQDFNVVSRHPAPGSNPIFNELKSLNLICNKHIPWSFKKTSIQNRLELLAGLIDSDGSKLSTNGFVFSNANEMLVKDVEWLARSLGFMVKVGKYRSEETTTGFEGWSWYVRIRGHVSTIPTKVARKQSVDNKKHRGSTYLIKAEPIGEGDYFGFMIDGNGRFLLDDFTVTHNTTMALNIALNVVSPAIAGDVIYYTCEISQELAIVRALARLSGAPLEDMYVNPTQFIENAEAAMQMQLAGHFLVKGYPSKSVKISDIDAHLHTVQTQMGIHPKLVVIDYAENIQPSDKDASEHQQAASIFTEARAMGQKRNCAVLMPDRCNKETVSQAVPSMTSFQGAFQKSGIVDAAIGLCATDSEFVANVMRWFVFLNRHGPAYQHFRGKVEPDKYKLEILEEIPYEPEESNRKRKNDLEHPLPAELQEG